MSNRRKVLIVEDEVELCELLRNYFQRRQFDVHVSHTLNEGNAMIDSIRPDLILLDNNLPDGTGWSSASDIFLRHPSSFVIFISGYHPALPALPDHARYSVIEKPISLHHLDHNLNTLRVAQ